MNRFALKGTICDSLDKDHIRTVENGYVVCEDGICAGVFEELPGQYQDVPVYDYGEQLIIPGLIDLHVHAPQYAFRGVGMDLELLEWLNTYAFVEEEKYKDLSYADAAYDIFTEDLSRSATTRACIFGTLHKEATLLLMEKLEKAGIISFVGKVNMDRNSPDYLCEKSAEESADITEEWILQCGGLKNVKPILTPRFTPTCSDALMERLSGLQKKYDLPMQSHLSENQEEIRWVKELCPDTECYGDAYDKYDLFGKQTPTIMAHCVYSGEKEMELMRANGVFVAHCPESNANIASGIAPIRLFLEKGIRVGLGSDVAGGANLSLFQAMALAIQCSKLRWRLVDQSLAPLTFEEVFYMATKGGGAFFGQVGSFEKGYEFDAIVLDDTRIRTTKDMDPLQRLERFTYLSESQDITAKYVCGRKLI